MEKIINYENLRNFTYVNDTICKMPIKGIVVSFFGLGGMTIYDNDFTDGELYAEKGILYVVPYNNPWAWMNKQAVKYTDEIIDVLIKKYDLDENIPIVSTGGSMGGQSLFILQRLNTPLWPVLRTALFAMLYIILQKEMIYPEHYIVRCLMKKELLKMRLKVYRHCILLIKCQK